MSGCHPVNWNDKLIQPSMNAFIHIRQILQINYDWPNPQSIGNATCKEQCLQCLPHDKDISSKKKRNNTKYKEFCGIL